MEDHKISRKKFLGLGAAATGAALFSGIGGNAVAQVLPEDNKGNSLKEYILSNVRLEDGFEYNEKNEVVATKTALYNLHIANGKIKSITTGKSTLKLKTVDAKGLLMLPGLRDMHIHIDKTYYGGTWNAAPRKGYTVKDMITLEQKIIPQLLTDSQHKAEEAIKLMQSQGSYFARCQCNIDPVSGLKSLEHLQAALEKNKDSFGWEIVAFPQHGILYSKSEPLLREAASMGIDFIGGLDPTSVDGNMEKSLDTMIQIALDTNKGIDIHLHEGVPSGKDAIEYIIKKTEENKQLQGKTYISHGFALARMDPKDLEGIAEKMGNLGIGVVSTIPIGRTIMPIPTLKKYGVKLMTGTDSIVDHWQPFGTCDMLEKAKLCAQLYGWTDEYSLSRALHIATKDEILPLNDSGTRVWPAVDSEANFILVKATCSAEAVARLPKREGVFYKGKVIAGEIGL
ncbi:amidohydrolase [Flavobacterium hibernum]|uniref:Deaminase n=1 Tax=Flavobacterium hibernum TaxID=37752 RepID=A0A0D0EEA5_9FLAO|nr:amidohydrolase [Flavobacterium hibernum]KIO52014.1 deaminase [Flavobacterium hibernum]OXA89025.1 deaminase [Flavobacterium hibernum]STO09817.1 N-isopropylammelide isopropyl amidohydrolase [Flavobacterium hibernum]